MKQITVKNPNNLPCIEHDELTVLQGDLKTLMRENVGKVYFGISNHCIPAMPIYDPYCGMLD